MGDELLRQIVGDSSCYNEAIQTACLAGVEEIVDRLLSRRSVSPTTIVHAHELMGTTSVLNCSDYEAGKMSWREALCLRMEYSCPKTIDMAKDVYDNHVEFQTMDELEAISSNEEALKMQAFIISERILGLQHPATLSRLRMFGLHGHHQRRLHFQKYILKIHLKNNVLSEVVYSALAELICALMSLHQHNPSTYNSTGETSQLFKDAVDVFAMLSEAIRGVTELPAESHPCHVVYDWKYVIMFDTILKSLVHFIYLMVTNANTQEDMHTVRTLVSDLVKEKKVSLLSKDTLLHMCLSEKTQLHLRQDGFLQPIFPSYDVAKVLLECGAGVNEKNLYYFSPLRLAAEPVNYSPELVQLLLQYGAHVDQPDHYGGTPAIKLPRVDKTFDVMDHITLQCLAARVVAKSPKTCFSYRTALPPEVADFVELHTYGEETPTYQQLKMLYMCDECRTTWNLQSLENA